MGGFIRRLIGMLPQPIRMLVVIIALSLASGYLIHMVASEGQANRISHLEKSNQELSNQVNTLTDQVTKLKEAAEKSVPKSTLDSANDRIVALQAQVNRLESERATAAEELSTPKIDTVTSYWNPWGDKGPWFQIETIQGAGDVLTVDIRSSQWPGALNFNTFHTEETFSRNSKQYILKVGKIRSGGVELHVRKKA